MMRQKNEKQKSVPRAAHTFKNAYRSGWKQVMESESSDMVWNDKEKMQDRHKFCSIDFREKGNYSQGNCRDAYRVLVLLKYVYVRYWLCRIENRLTLVVF